MLFVLFRYQAAGEALGIIVASGFVYYEFLCTIVRAIGNQVEANLLPRALF